MERINRIISHPLWLEAMEKIRHLEERRIFCGHGISHLLDVGRIAYIYCLEKEINIPKDIIYGAALVHDIGRGEEYRNGTPHEKAGAVLSERILKDTGYTEEEIREITGAVLAHRQKKEGEAETLPEIIYMADKKSRCCFLCSAEKECNWNEERKNRTIER